MERNSLGGYDMKTPPAQKLRIPTNWAVKKHSFYSLEPDAEPKFKSMEHDDGWLLFDFELLLCDYEKGAVKWILDMGWIEARNPEGQFWLSLIDTDYTTSEEMTICQTRSLAEITKAINDTMFRISLESGDYETLPTNLQLQGLAINGGWKFVKNEFYDFDPQNSTNVEGLLGNNALKLMTEEMLLLESASYQIKLGWFPAHDPDGIFISEVIDNKRAKKQIAIMKTQDKDAIVEFIEERTFDAHKIK